MLRLLGRRTDTPTETRLGTCSRHGFDRATGVCGECGEGFCGECLVHPFGARRAGLCVSCALVRAGVRR